MRSVAIFLVALLAAAVQCDGASLRPNMTVGSCADAPACGVAMACYSGVCAYSNGRNQCSGNSCDGDGIYGLRFQCVELGQRFFAVKHGIAKVWHDNANGMCSNIPAGVSKVADPAAGDLIVFDWAPYGHVAVISAVSGNSIDVIEQNNSPTGRNTYARGSEMCFLRA